MGIVGVKPGTCQMLNLCATLHHSAPVVVVQWWAFIPYKLQH